MSTSREVEALAGGFLRQVEGIFPGIGKLPLAFREVESREQAVTERERAMDSAEATQAGLIAENAALEVRKRELTQQVAALEPDVREAVRVGTLKTLLLQKVARLAELDAAISSKQSTLDRLAADLAALKPAHNLT